MLGLRLLGLPPAASGAPFLGAAPVLLSRRTAAAAAE
jgi:hypothetical protein